MTVRQLLANVTSDEITDWMAFDLIEQRGGPPEPVESKLMKFFGGAKNG